MANDEDEGIPELAPIDEELDIIGREDVVSVGTEEERDCEDGALVPMKDDVGEFDREEDAVSTGDPIGVNAKMSEVVSVPASEGGVVDTIG